jgi:hypothetical protein
MSRLSPFLSPRRRKRERFVLLSVPLLAGVALIALAIGSGGVSSSPAEEQHEHEPDAQVVAAVRGYAQETNFGYDHVLRWMRVLKSFGELEGMTAGEAEDYADQYDATRWNPVVAELTKLENGGSEPDSQVVAAVRGHAQETVNGYDHVLRWMRALVSLGALQPMSAAEAQGYANQYDATRWDPVVAELEALEAAASDPEPTETPEPTPVPMVIVTAQSKSRARP